MRDWRQSLRSKWVRNIALGLLLADGLGIYAADLRLNQPGTVDENFAVAEEYDTLAYSEPYDAVGSFLEPNARFRTTPATGSFDADQPANAGAAGQVSADSGAPKALIMVRVASMVPVPRIQLPNLTERPNGLSLAALVRPAQESGQNAFPSRERHADAGYSEAYNASVPLAIATMPAVKTNREAGRSDSHSRRSRQTENYGGDPSRQSSLAFASAFAQLDAATISGSAPPSAVADVAAPVTLGRQTGSSSEFQDYAMIAAPQAHDAAQGAGSVAAAPAYTQDGPQETARVEVQPAPQEPANQAVPVIVLPSIAFGHGS